MVAGCLPQVEREALFERFPFVDVALGPQHLHELPAALAGRRAARLLRRRRRALGRAARAPRAPVPGLGPGHVGLHQRLLLLHRARRPGPGAQPPAGRDRLRGALAGRRRRARGHAAGPERQRLRQRPSPEPAQLRRAAARPRRHRRPAPSALHDVASPRPLRRARRGDRRAAVGLRARPPAGPVGLRPRTGRDGARVYHGVVSGEGGSLACKRSPTSRSRPT